MAKKVFLGLAAILLGFFLLQVSAPAKGGPRKADINKDGVVDKKESEIRKEKNAEVNTWWEKRADTDNSGTVEKNEASDWKELKKERIDLNDDGTIDAKERGLSWRNGRSKVNTAVEQKYDSNSDGFLETSEVKEMLQDKYTIIKTDGKAKVDTEVEKQYDVNSDGV